MNNSPTSESNTSKASKLLRSELRKPHAKKIWSAYLPDFLARADSDVISYRAVARALASAQHRLYGLEDSPSRYKDRVRRAIIGQRMTAETLQLFAETFDFSDELHHEITKFIAADQIIREQSTIPSRNQFITPTSTFYDIYFNRELKPYKIECTMVIRALVDSVSYVWAANSSDIERIEFLEGGTSSWQEEINAWKLTLDYPLVAQESALIRYCIHLKLDVPQQGLISLDYGTTRNACSYRLIFDENTTNIPQTIRVSRKFATATSSPFNVEQKDDFVPVFGRRASIYIENIFKEELIFSDADSGTSQG